MAVYLRANAPSDLSAKNVQAAQLVDLDQIAQETQPTKMEVVKRTFGATKDGQEIDLYSCSNLNGYSFDVITYGGSITAVRAPDKNGTVENVTLSCNDIEGYQACTTYFGSTVGRYCNRIANGKFELDGQTYTLAANNGENHLHGGKVGFDKLVWSAEELSTDDSVGVRLKLISPDGRRGLSRRS